MQKQRHPSRLLPYKITPLSACLVGVLTVGTAISCHAQQQPYPTKAIRVIVPYGPGTAPDTIARIASDGLQKRLGQSLVIENRTGAGGKIGTEAAANATADGYTLFLGTKDSQSYLIHLHPTWSVKPDQALKPIAGLAKIENVLLTRNNASAPASLSAMLDTASKKELTYGSPGVGTNLHLMGELLKSGQKNVKLLHIPFSKSAAEALPAVIRGDLDLLFSGLPPALPLIKDGKLKPLAITGTVRSRYLPNVPTFAESGIQGFETGGWFGLFAPSGTPAFMLKKLETEIASVMQEASYKERLESLSAEVWTASPAELSRVIEVDGMRAGKLIRENRIAAE
ncbi:Bug family tripartite tricarboxylate transporter substrate binding protein [Diaphorobacter caeni]|uniref:Bug family tripartite tricarboxylate transporter substrate binding protein n=1 Tax=Diaphorobacter caeni TaxID=2784387 RepID=UPI0018907D50|nr:tripartite tricarboxylate transporter substrate binding protein [Diaphorobacter caeni]MBF5007744.1 tripartite tricarboxylate transporter substrate binding protein [Diaphorobacter caeni]